MFNTLPEKISLESKDTKKNILIVEDAESIILAINDYLSSSFNITAATTICDAQKEVLKSIQENSPFDLIVTDINLTDLTGFDLIRFVREHSRQTKVALITAYEINDYIDIIYREGIDQVITKHSQMSLHEIKVMAQKMLSQDIFGIDKYFSDIHIFYPSELNNLDIPQNKQIFSITIKSTQDKVYWINKIADILQSVKNVPMAVSRLVMDELLSNAMFRAPRFEDGKYKYQKKNNENSMLIPHDNVVLSPEDYVIFQYGFYNDWVILTCQDPHGNLRKQEILYRLYRHIALDPESKLPQGISDSHGRGIFLLREHLTNLVFNIQKNRKTEIIGFYHVNQNIPYKNISIYEKEG
jgi:CheY-like chemotaxis protein